MKTTAPAARQPRALAACAFAFAITAAPAALAQSTVQIYGLLDAGVEVNRSGAPGTGRTVLLNSGNQAASRLGFKGTEDLGGGMSAVFNIEMGIFNDSGTLVFYGEPSQPTWGRRAIVGLQGSLGEIVLGRDYTPGFWTLVQSDRFGYGLPGTVSTPSNITTTRANNGIFYKTPNLGGFIGRAAYSLGVENAAPPRRLGHLAAVSGDYKFGGLLVTAAFQNRKDLLPGSTTQLGSFNEYGAGLQYDFAPYVVNLGTWHTDPLTATADAVDKTSAFWIGAGVRVDLVQINLQVARTRIDYVGRAGGTATTFGVSATYPLSKRTYLYTAFGGVQNPATTRLALNTGSQRVGGLVFGADPRAVLVGMRHLF
jgi:predicted porin